MGAKIIDGQEVALTVRTQVRNSVSAWIEEGHAAPGLATILIGDDPASAIYVEGKQRACLQVGIKAFDHRLPVEVNQKQVEQLIIKLNNDSEVSGILLQLPTPPQIDSQQLIELIDPKKDVDGLTSPSVAAIVENRAGLRPCTPLGIMKLLQHYDVNPEGKEAVVIGRSALVGRPLFSLLLAENATVTICHSRTRDLGEVCSRADILVAAIGKANLIKGEWVKDGATVIDVGINRVDGKLIGDVEFESASKRAGLITPVPGGVGPMTIAMLLSNTMQAARIQA